MVKVTDPADLKLIPQRKKVQHPRIICDGSLIDDFADPQAATTTLLASATSASQVGSYQSYSDKQTSAQTLIFAKSARHRL